MFPPYLPPMQPPVTTSMDVERIKGVDRQATDAAMTLEGETGAILRIKEKIANPQLALMMSCEQYSLQHQPPVAIMCQRTKLNRPTDVVHEIAIHRKKVNVTRPTPTTGKKAARKHSLAMKEKKMPKNLKLTETVTVVEEMPEKLMHLGTTAVVEEMPKKLEHIETITEVKVPKQVDVLMGRMYRSMVHVGNFAFRALVNSKVDLYMRARRKRSKMAIIIEITNSIYAAGGRFLELQNKEKTNWREVDVEKARTKVGDAIRDCAKKAKNINSGKKRPPTLLRSFRLYPEVPSFHESATFADILDYFVSALTEKEIKATDQTRLNSGPTVEKEEGSPTAPTNPINTQSVANTNQTSSSTTTAAKQICYFTPTANAKVAAKHTLTINEPQVINTRPGIMPFRKPDPTIVVEVPKPVDVLLGRMYGSVMHVGNFAFRALVDSKMDLYTRAHMRPRDKLAIVIDITNSIYAAGGHFLELQSNKEHTIWREVDVERARERVIEALRYRFKKPCTDKKKQPAVHTFHRLPAVRTFHESATFADIVDYFYFVRDLQGTDSSATAPIFPRRPILPRGEPTLPDALANILLFQRLSYRPFSCNNP